MKIYCVQCQNDVDARLTDGVEIYPHRPDLGELPFWKCDACKNYVGCHHKTSDRTKPLGNIPNKEIKAARQHIHKILDPLWQSGQLKRGQLYARVSKAICYQYHTAEIRSVDEARRIYNVIREIAKGAL
jgi:hypothetical protein